MISVNYIYSTIKFNCIVDRCQKSKVSLADLNLKARTKLIDYFEQFAIAITYIKAGTRGKLAIIIKKFSSLTHC